MDVLDVTDCGVTINQKEILSNVSLKIQKGQIVALVGHNGAGKSTLMKAIIGSQEKSQGKVAILTKDQDKEFRAYKKLISYIPEEPLLLSELTAYQHFQLYQKSYDIPDHLFQKRVNEYSRAFEIEDKLDEYPESLSKGMRQKVQTICALLPDVPLLLIDEPFMGLDVYAGSYLESVLLERKQGEISILLTTHQLEKVRKFADYYVMLQNGKVTKEGNIDTLEALDRRSRK